MGELAMIGLLKLAAIFAFMAAMVTAVAAWLARW